MMVSETTLGFKLSTTRARITPRAGLALVWRMAQRLGVRAKIARALGHLKRRQRGFSVVEHALDWVATFVCGGQSASDLRVLRADGAALELAGRAASIAPRTGREFLSRFDRRSVGRLSQVVGETAAQVGAEARVRTATLDVDATFIESHKRGAKRSYHGEPGYYPMLGFWAETQACLLGQWRDGNVSPSSGAPLFLAQLVRRLPSGIERVRVRSDSAWFNHTVMDWCAGHGIEFAITGQKNTHMIDVIEAIAVEQWEPFETGRAGADQIAETVYSFEHGAHAWRIIVVRAPMRQLEMFEGLYEYRVVITNMGWDKRRLVRWHRERATSENWIKELKAGFGLEQLPSGRFESNAAYFQLVLLAYNLICALKRLALPAAFALSTIKTLRFHFIHIAAVVVRHARQLVVKLAQGCQHLAVFRRILAPG